VAPAAGTIALSASGFCSASEGGFVLAAYIDSGGWASPVQRRADPNREACVITVSEQVTKGQEVDLKVALVFNPTQPNSGYVDHIATFVYFTP
jgi:hypothetical protein